MQRIIVIGCTSSGKSTVARALSKKLDLPYIDLDDLHHLPGWIERPSEEFRTMAAAATRGEKWICAGNYYSRVQDITWPKADTLIWLDMPFWPNFWKLLTRTFKRAYTGETICNGNKETLSKQFFTSDSILWWLIKTWSRNRSKYGAIFAKPEKYPHLKMIRLGSYQESRDFIESVSL